MAYRFRFVEGENLVLVVAEGRVTGDEIIASAARMFEDGRWRPDTSQICDFRGIDGLALTYAHVKAILDLEKQYGHKIGPGKQALVVRNEVQHSICLLYKTMAQLARRPQTIKVLRSMEDALAWLGKEHLPEIVLTEGIRNF